MIDLDSGSDIASVRAKPEPQFTEVQHRHGSEPRSAEGPSGSSSEPVKPAASSAHGVILGKRPVEHSLQRSGKALKHVVGSTVQAGCSSEDGAHVSPGTDRNGTSASQPTGEQAGVVVSRSVPLHGSNVGQAARNDVGQGTVAVVAARSVGRAAFDPFMVREWTSELFKALKQEELAMAVAAWLTNQGQDGMEMYHALVCRISEFVDEHGIAGDVLDIGDGDGGGGVVMNEFSREILNHLTHYNLCNPEYVVRLEKLVDAVTVQG